MVYRDAPRHPSIGFSSLGSNRSPPSSPAYSFVLKSLMRTMTGLGAKAAAIVETPSATRCTKKSRGDG